MADPTSILLDSLKETFKAIERFLFTGFTSVLVLIVVAATHEGLTGVSKVMFIDVDAPSGLVGGVALAAYWACGVFATLYFWGRRGIVRRLRESDPAILDAALTYPSVVARAGWLQMSAIVGLVGCAFVAIHLLYPLDSDFTKFLLASTFFALPYIALFVLAFATGVEELRAESNPRSPALSLQEVDTKTPSSGSRP
jgi:hypothetical protein